jgi:hypothetical protein
MPKTAQQLTGPSWTSASPFAKAKQGCSTDSYIERSKTRSAPSPHHCHHQEKSLRTVGNNRRKINKSQITMTNQKNEGNLPSTAKRYLASESNQPKYGRQYSPKGKVPPYVPKFNGTGSICCSPKCTPVAPVTKPNHVPAPSHTPAWTRRHHQNTAMTFPIAKRISAPSDH